MHLTVISCTDYTNCCMFRPFGNGLGENNCFIWSSRQCHMIQILTNEMVNKTTIDSCYGTYGSWDVMSSFISTLTMFSVYSTLSKPDVYWFEAFGISQHVFIETCRMCTEPCRVARIALSTKQMLKNPLHNHKTFPPNCPLYSFDDIIIIYNIQRAPV